MFDELLTEDRYQTDDEGMDLMESDFYSEDDYAEIEDGDDLSLDLDEYESIEEVEFA